MNICQYPNTILTHITRVLPTVSIPSPSTATLLTLSTIYIHWVAEVTMAPSTSLLLGLTYLFLPAVLGFQVSNLVMSYLATKIFVPLS